MKISYKFVQRKLKLKEIIRVQALDEIMRNIIQKEKFDELIEIVKMSF